MDPELADRKFERERRAKKMGPGQLCGGPRVSLGGWGRPLCGAPSRPRAWGDKQGSPVEREVPGHGGSCCKGPRRERLEFLRSQRGGLGGTQGERGQGGCWALLGGWAWGFPSAKGGSPVGPGVRGSPALFLVQENLLHFPLEAERPTEGSMQDGPGSPPLAAFPGVRAVHT